MRTSTVLDPFLYISQWDSADWIHLSTVNYGRTHLLLNKRASFIFGGGNQNNNKAWHQRAQRNLILNEHAGMKRGCILVFVFLGTCDAFWNVTARERDKGKWSGRWRGAAHGWTRYIQWLPPSFMQCKDIKTNMPRLLASSCLNLIWCSAFRLPWIQVDHGLYQVRKRGGRVLDSTFFFFDYQVMHITKTSAALSGTAVTIMIISSRNDVFFAAVIIMIYFFYSCTNKLSNYGSDADKLHKRIHPSDCTKLSFQTRRWTRCLPWEWCGLFTDWKCQR